VAAAVAIDAALIAKNPKDIAPDAQRRCRDHDLSRRPVDMARQLIVEINKVSDPGVA